MHWKGAAKSAVASGGVALAVLACAAIPTFSLGTNVDGSSFVESSVLDGGPFPDDASDGGDKHDARDVDAGPVRYRLFVTGTAYPGTFGRDGGARLNGDKLCRDAAENRNMRGSWSALIWVNAQNSPFATVKAVPEGWYQVLEDGGPGALVYAIDGGRQAAPVFSESGQPFVGKVWTGGSESTYASNCDDWTAASPILGAFGLPYEPHAGWLWGSQTQNCGSAGSLYCIEQPPQ